VTAILQRNQGSADRKLRIEPLLDERAIAVILGLSAATTRRWSLQEIAQGSVKTGAAVRYRRDGSQGWMAARSSGGGVTAEVTL
jgi:hypothetical protein